MSRAGLSRRGRNRPACPRGARAAGLPARAGAVAVGLLPLVLLGGCSHRDKSAANAPAVLASDESPPGAITMVGVAPSAFRCASMATPKEVGDIVGAKVVLAPSQFEPPQGVAKPCNYAAAADESGANAAVGAAPPERAKHAHGKHGKHGKRAEHGKAAAGAAGAAAGQPAQKMWSVDFDCRKTALKDGEALMVQYAKTNGAVPVRVGKSGLDYENAALLFIDNDSPCYARVLGPGAKNRLAIAKLVAGRLTTATAPMTPVVRRTAR